MKNNDVLVLDAERRFLEYCHPATARRMLKEGKAVVYAREPFTIQLNRAVESPNRSRRNEEIMAQVTNFTEFFKEERDIYVQNISNCQVSVSFEVSPGHSESYLFTNSKDPVNLTRHIPFAAIKQSMDLRRMINRVPPALTLLTNEEFHAYYKRQASTQGLHTAEEAIDKAETRRAAIQNHTPLTNAPDPVKLHEVVEDGKHFGERKVVQSVTDPVSEAEEINPRILNLCLQVHPSIPDQQKMSAQQVLSELDMLNDLSMMDWEYLQSHGYYKSVRNLARKKVADLAAESVEPDEPAAPKKAPKKSAKTTISAE